MKIISWNINSLRSHEAAFRHVIDTEQPDIFCLQEIRVREDQATFPVKGYRSFMNPATLSQYYGTGIFIKENIHPMSITFDPYVDGHDYEGRIEAIELKDFILINSYWPFSSTKEFLRWRVEWTGIFQEFVHDLQQKKPVVICGDTNMVRGELDTFDGKYIKRAGCFYPEEHETFEKFLKEERLIDTYRFLHPNGTAQSTWANEKTGFNRKQHKGFRIDLFLVIEKLLPLISASEVFEKYEGSDHCPILLKMKE